MGSIIQNKSVALSKVVNAAIVDNYDDIGRMEQRASFMTARGLKKLYIESLPKLKHKAWLPVNRNTFTATLPVDFDSETFIGYIDSNWQKVSMRVNTNLTDTRNIEDIECEDKCDKCKQDKGICNDLVITEEKKNITVNDEVYEEVITKKLYPNGDYYLQTDTYIYDIETEEVLPYSKKEFIVNFDLKPCGCLETSETNATNLKTYCPDIYCNYYSQYSSCCDTSYGGYNIFEESGLIQLDYKYPYDKVYIEYWGFIQKIKGQYYVPMVSFETLVEWTKWKLIANKKNVPRWERQDQLESYKRERRNMERVLGRVSLYQIAKLARLIPKFDIDYGDSWYSCFTAPLPATPIVVTTTTCDPVTGVTTTSETKIVSRTNYTLAVKVNGNPGSPVAGSTTYQNNLLKGAVDIKYIIVAKTIETILDGDFTFDTITGTIDRSPNSWEDEQSLIVHYNKNLITTEVEGGVGDGDITVEVETHAIAVATLFAADTWVRVLVDETEDNNKVMYKVTPSLELEFQYIIP